MRQKWLAETTLSALLGAIVVTGYFYWQFPTIFKFMFLGIPAGLHNGPESGLLPTFFGGDHIQVMYLAWKLKQAVAGSGFSILTDSYNFANLALPFYDFNIGVQFQILAIMMALTGSETAGYTLAMLPVAGFLLFLSGYFLAAQASTSPIVRFLSGLYFVVIPYRVWQSVGGHSGGVVMFLHCLYWAAVLRGKKNENARFAPYLAGTMLFLLTISDEHQGYYAILFSGIVLPAWLIQSVTLVNWRMTLKTFLMRWAPLIAGLIFTIGYGLVLNAVTMNPEGGVSPHRDLNDVAFYSIATRNFFSAGNLHNIGSTLGPLFVIGILAVGLSRSIKLKDVIRSTYFPFLICFFLATMLMGGVDAESIKNPGVYGFFFDYAPFFSYQRVPTKMFTSTAIFMVIMIAMLQNWIFKKFSAMPKQNLARSITALVSVAFCIQIVQMHRAINNAGLPLIEPVYSAVPETDRQLILNEVAKNELIFFVPLSEVMNRYATKQQLMAMLTSRQYSGGYNGLAPESYLSMVRSLRPFNYFNGQQEFFNQIKGRGFKALVFDLKGPRDIYDSNAVNAGRFSHFFSTPSCGETLCVMRLL